MQSNDTSLAARFWSKVDKRGLDECWEWTRCLDAQGYGKFNIRARVNRFAHRMAYELMVGPIPDGLVIDHLCRNPRCVNPAHLEAVTQEVNCQRRFAVRRVPVVNMIQSHRDPGRTHCKHGHELTEISIRISSNGGVYCRICQRRYRAEHRARLRAAMRLAKLPNKSLP